MANMNADEIKMIEGFFTDGSKSESSLVRFEMNKEKSSPNELSLNLTITSRDGHRRFDKKKQDTGQQDFEKLDKLDKNCPRAHKDVRPLLKNPFEIAAAELQKFNQSVHALQRKSGQLLNILDKADKSRDIDIQALKNQAYMDMNLLRMEVKRHHRELNNRQQFGQVPRQTKCQIDKLKTDITKLTNDNKEKQGEIERLKGIIDAMSYDVNQKESLVAALQCRVGELEAVVRMAGDKGLENEVQAAMDVMLVEVEHRNSTDILNNEIKIMSDKIAGLCQQIEKSNLQKSNLFTKTKSLEDRLKFAQQSTKSKITSNSKHSMSISNQNNPNQMSFALDPTETDIEEWINMFTQYHTHFHTKCKIWIQEFKDKYRQKPTNKDKEMEPLFYLKVNFQNILTQLKSMLIHKQKCQKQNKSPLKQVVLQLQRNNPHNNSSILTTINNLDKPKQVRALQCQLDLLRKSLDSLKKDRTRLETQNQNLLQSLKAMQTQLMNRRQDSISILEDQNNVDPRIIEYEKKIEEMNRMLIEQKLKLKALVRKKNQLTQKCQNHEITIKDLQFHLEKEIFERRKLHNQVEDLKGNIRVYCRVRPLVQSQIQRNCRNIIQVDYDSVILTDKNKKYHYDAVFGQDSSQQQVFEDTKRLVQSALDGFNVCIFAYGQTGSGKTFTLHGSMQHPGISHRVIQQLFRLIHTNKFHHSVTVQMNMIEIYGDSLHDLCQPENRELEIGEDSSKNTFVRNCYKIKVSSAKEMSELFKNSLRNRKVSATDMNPESSRSHIIFIIYLEIFNQKTKEKRYGKMYIVDLAGSQRMTKSGLTKQQSKQAQAINLSLTALNDVMVALNRKSSHIPYRNSKLTYLLQNSIGGDSKTLMFVNVSPADYNSDETMTSLQFANRVKNVTRTPNTVAIHRDRNLSEDEVGKRALTRVEFNNM